MDKMAMYSFGTLGINLRCLVFFAARLCRVRDINVWICCTVTFSFNAPADRKNVCCSLVHGSRSNTLCTNCKGVAKAKVQRYKNRFHGNASFSFLYRLGRVALCGLSQFSISGIGG